MNCAINLRWNEKICLKDMQIFIKHSKEDINCEEMKNCFIKTIVYWKLCYPWNTIKVKQNSDFILNIKS